MTDLLAAFLAPGTPDDVTAAYAGLAERAADAVWGFEDEIAVVDVETTGFDPDRDHIIEVAALVARGPEVLGRYATLVDPGVAIPAETTRLTGIGDSDVAGAPRIEAAVTRLGEAVGGRVMVAHNASFDRGFLSRLGGGAGLAGGWVDTLELSRIALPRLRSHRLKDLAAAFGVALPHHHRAGDDVEALFRVWRVLLAGLQDLPEDVLGAVAALDDGARWDLRSLLSHHAAARPARSLDLVRTRRSRVDRDRAEPLHDAAEMDVQPPDPDRVREAFAAGGLVGAMYDGFETREEQSQMAVGVAEAFAEGRHLAVEAGTGVGKSVAYLVPAALLALDNRIGVGVATKTNTLMDQLVHGELPRLAAALGGGLRYVALKGYDHYVCLRKLARLAVTPAAGDEELRAATAALLAWTAQTTWGDLEAVNIHLPEAVRRAVVATTGECVKKRCRFYPGLCLLHGARKRACTAHVVVTNHALLFRDLTANGGILPPLRYWVVDEAHSAEAEARKQLSLDASCSELSGLLRGLHQSGRGGYLDALRTRLASSRKSEGADALARLDTLVAEVGTASTLTASFFDFLKDIGEGIGDPGGYGALDIRISPRLRETGTWGTAAGVGRSLLKRLDSVVREGKTLVGALEELGESFAEQRLDLVGQIIGLADQMAGLGAVLDGESDEYVYRAHIVLRRDVPGERIGAEPVDVGAMLAEELYPKLTSVVYTSATIAAGDDFSHFERSVGLDRLPEGSHATLRLASSYDFERQMAVFVPTDIEEPGSAGSLERLERLLLDVHEAMGGSVLTLFTNRRDMLELYRRLASPLAARGLQLLVQGRGVSRKRLRDEFLADERLSLFATRSFWEGFDAKGDTLRCVVVPKLPFGQVREPLLEERKARDPDWWDRYYLPAAVLELKQAAGRLIRSSTDTGCLVLADGRLVTRGYGRRFLDALPVSDVELLPAQRVGEEIARRFGRPLP
ncbi:MAG: helicase C-terminal domain-containing protein [Coriobacteriia bacterium]